MQQRITSGAVASFLRVNGQHSPFAGLSRLLSDSGTAELRLSETDWMPHAMSLEDSSNVRDTDGMAPEAYSSLQSSKFLLRYAEGMQAILTERAQDPHANRTHAYFVGVAMRLAGQGRKDCMVDVIQEMPLEGVAPSRKILRMALDAALLDENLTEALLLVSEMQRHSCRVSVEMHAAILRLASKKSQHAFALKYSEEISNQGVHFNEDILNALLYCYGKLGKLDRAVDILDLLDSSSKPIQMDAFTSCIEAAVEACRRNAKIMTKEKASSLIQHFFVRAVQRFTLELDTPKRDELLAATMQAYRALGNLAAAIDAYDHIHHKTRKQQSNYMACKLQEASQKLQTALQAPARALEIQHYNESCRQLMDELGTLSGEEDSYLQPEDACQMMQAILRCERYISEARDRGEIEDLDTERPMELAEKTLAHLNFSGLELPRKAGSLLLIEALSSQHSKQREFGMKVLQSLRRYDVDLLDEAASLVRKTQSQQR